MKEKVLFLVVFLYLSVASFAQGFTNINAGLTGLHWSDVAWGDYDNDGDLDVIVAGLNSSSAGVTTIYRNDGNDTFTALTVPNLPGTFVGDLAWGDFDADGDLDLLIQGYTDAAQITKIYINTHNDNFSDSGIAFPELVDGSVSFVDYNNDGYLDILLAGYNDITYITILYKNNGDATFTNSGINLPGTIKSAYEWGDYDNDGDMDIFITGFDANGILISKLFENKGNESFIETFNSFTGTWLGDVAWGDYDSDGYLDILLSGFTISGERIAKVYKNNGDGSFSELLSTGLVGVSHASTIWGDYDNDGDLDIFIGGTYEGDGGWVRVTDVFINNGDDTFTAANLSFSKDVYWGESAWGDYDNDGDLDLICCGFDDLGGSNTIIYRNNASSANTPPESPQNLSSVITENEVSLSWDSSSDAETPTSGLSYNAYIRTESGIIIWNSMSEYEDGFRLIPALGNAQQNTGWAINNLEMGNYFWSVQAIDNNFEGSIFADEASFTISTVGLSENPTIDNSNNLSNYPNPFSQSTTITFSLQEHAYVNILIYNTNGQIVNSLINQSKDSGKYSVKWDGISSSGAPLKSGIYYYILKINGVPYVKEKCLLFK